MKIDRLRPVVGNWAGGDSFFDREVELWDLVTRIRRGASISLTAPRRIGKTSLLREVSRTLDEEMTCVFVDLEGSATAEDAIAEIAAKAERHRNLASVTTGWAQRILGLAEVDLKVVKVDLRDALKAEWQASGSRLVSELCKGPSPVVVFLDELPVLVANLLQLPDVGGRNPADLFLSWLRKQTQENPDKLRVVLTGSIGLAPLVARAGLSATLNAYEIATLGPWSRETTIDALHALAKHEALSFEGGAAAEVHDLLGIGVPYHVQLLFQAIAEGRRRQTTKAVTVDDVKRAWEAVLSRPSADLPHWEQRLRKALPPVEFRLAERLLTETSITEPLVAERAHEISRQVANEAPAGAMPDPHDALRAVLGALQHDGYLGFDRSSGWYFPNRLLRAWWNQQYAPLHPVVR